MAHAWGHGTLNCSTLAKRTSSLYAKIRNAAVCLLASLCLVAAMVPVSSSANVAYADTESELNAAKERFEEVQAQLDQLIADCAAISEQQVETQQKIDATRESIREAEELIAQKEQELALHQKQLSDFAVESYKSDTVGFLDVLMSSQSFESFISMWRYVDRINAQKMALIDQVRDIKQELSERKAQLEADMAELETLSAQLEEQMESLTAKQAETQELLDSLDEEVKSLTEQYNRELAARAAAEAAARNAWANNQSYAEFGYEAPDLVVTGQGSVSDVIAACYATGSPGYNLCAAWVTYVFNNAGVGRFSGNANDMYANWCYSSDLSELQPGMIVAVGTNPKGGWAGLVYGHVGIYIGDGIVMENIGYIARTPLSEWLSWYNVAPRWGWIGGVVLS